MHNLTDDTLSPEADAFLTAALEEFRAKQQRLRDAWGLDQVAQWDYADGRLSFTLEDGSRLAAEGEPLGSYAPEDGSWEWAFQNPEAGEGVAAVKEVGEALGVPYLRHGLFRLPDPALIPYLTAAGIKALGADGAFIGDTGELMVAFALGRLTRLAPAAAAPEPALAPVVPSQSIAPVPGAAAPVAANPHTLLFQPGSWAGEGRMRVAVVPEPMEIAGSLSVSHGPFWELEITLGDYRTRYTLRPLGDGEEACEWSVLSEQFGPGVGRLSVVGDTLLTAGESEDGAMRSVESFRRIADERYEARGVVFVEGERYASWEIAWVRA